MSVIIPILCQKQFLIDNIFATRKLRSINYSFSEKLQDSRKKHYQTKDFYLSLSKIQT